MRRRAAALLRRLAQWLEPAAAPTPSPFESKSGRLLVPPEKILELAPAKAVVETPPPAPPRWISAHLPGDWGGPYL